MKRVLSIFCAIILGLGLCACGSDSATNDAAENITESTTESQEDLEEKEEPSEDLKENEDTSETDDAMDHFSDAVDQLIDAVQNEDENIMGVKLGTTSNYPGVTYGDAFDEFFAKPKWEYFKGLQEGPDDDGDGKPDYTNEDVDVVEFTGYCTYMDVEVKALIQFTLDNEGGTFEATYLSFNEVPQSTMMLYGLVSKAFESYMEEHGMTVDGTSDASSQNSIDYLKNVNRSAVRIEPWEIAGYYGGDYGQSTADLSIYSSPEGEEMGNARIYLDSEIGVYGGNEYAGTLVEIDDNIYLLQTAGDEELLLAVDYTDDGYLCFEFWIDGQWIETYYMIEHYES